MMPRSAPRPRWHCSAWMPYWRRMIGCKSGPNSSSSERIGPNARYTSGRHGHIGGRPQGLMVCFSTVASVESGTGVTTDAQCGTGNPPLGFRVPRSVCVCACRSDRLDSSQLLERDVADQEATIKELQSRPCIPYQPQLVLGRTWLGCEVGGVSGPSVAQAALTPIAPL